jgi:hypothetical protein
MVQVRLTLTPETPHPAAGYPFQVSARLENPATDDLVISFEKHRVFVDTSGGRELCVITDGYFTQDGFPKPIDLKRGESEGSTSVTVSAQAINPPCPEIKPPPQEPIPVEFPDRLMLTAFVRTKEGGGVIGKEHVVLTIYPLSHIIRKEARQLRIHHQGGSGGSGVGTKTL